MMFAWHDQPSPVACPAKAMHPSPVWAATRPSASTTAVWRYAAPSSSRSTASSASLRRGAVAQPGEDAGAVAGLGHRLGGDRADAGAHVRHHRADGEPVRLDGHPELAGARVAGHEGVGHARNRDMSTRSPTKRTPSATRSSFWRAPLASEPSARTIAVPGDVGLVGGGQHPARVARGVRRDVRVGGDAPLGHGAHAGEDLCHLHGP